MANSKYTVVPTREAEKDIRRLKPWGEKATNILLQLEDTPTRGHALTGTLAGARSLAFSLPGGAYRAAYVVQEEKRICLVFLVGPHENFYKEARRRYRALKKRGEV